MENLGQYQQLVASYGMAIITKIAAAIVFWIVGRWLIGLVGRMLQRVLEKQKIDPSLIRYIGSFVAVTLNIVLVVAILGYFGVQTTTFAALVAGIGIAIGAGKSASAKGSRMVRFMRPTSPISQRPTIQKTMAAAILVIIAIP